MTATQTAPTLHVEDRGDGDVVLLVPGAGGDGALFDPLATHLTRRHRVLTYDRRGNSRSPRPEGWDHTTLHEQADDVVQVLDTVGVAQAHVLGTSGGGVIALEVARHHPERVSTVLLHEPALVHVLPEGAALHEQLRERLLTDRGEVDADGALARFLRFAYGDRDWQRIAPELRHRIASNGQVFLDIEFDVLTSGRPPDSTEPLPPTAVLRGPDGPPFLEPLCDLVAGRLATTVAATPGGHLGYFTHPAEFASAITRVLEEVSA